MFMNHWGACEIAVPIQQVWGEPEVVGIFIKAVDTAAVPAAAAATGVHSL